VIGLLKRVLPGPAVDALRSLRKTVRRTSFVVNKAAGAERVTAAEIAAAIRSLGVKAGSDAIVHSSMRGLGVIEGGPEAVIEAVLDVLGTEGTMLVPAYSMVSSMREHLEQAGVTLDAQNTPSTMGKISETLRMKPGATRSLHPTHSVAAYGARARFYAEGHELSETPCGRTSPFFKLIERKGWILCVGSPIGKVTSYHAFEDVCPDFPQAVYFPRKFPAKMIAADGRELNVSVYAHDPAVSKRRIDNTREIEAAFEKILARMGVLHTAPIGQGVIAAMRADKLHAALGELVKEGTTIYGIGSTRT
jgi:aminoglycoside 3-N-acetyltransferase